MLIGLYVDVIRSGTDVDNCYKSTLHLNELGNEQLFDELKLKYEEADLRIIPRIGWAITMFSRYRVKVTLL